MPERASWGGARTQPVSAHPEGASPYGCLDMAGNAREWTLTLWGSDWKSSQFPYPYKADDGREDPAAPPSVHRVFRGGSFADDPAFLRTGTRRWFAPDSADPRRGFRVAGDA